ncbi:Glu/Leu/Phe/Val dehydrogenase dimerization domain-containing protein [Hellea balneolensis]|uniref:Glu/Leu/Phe/Val dehydrogenase dimerization domain-containing protein n=1 Tax=Hellea balneolensis TaxID=287478 RepID=UPI0003FA87E0|nr:Glu/Leu/Phe/Val dehydrogenase dimerization domain-containing protein [Hellea balneolensis]
MSIFSHPDFDDHDGVYSFSDAKSGLRCFIAVHNTNRGPASGGTRFWNYVDDGEALTDVLRLSRAMSYKNAMAEIPLGGGKGVILKPQGDFDRETLFAAYGRAVEKVGGQYITAEDVGVSPNDMRTIKTQTDFVAGLDDGDAASGDPSPHTADGIFRGLEVAVKHKLGVEGVGGLIVAVQGLGHVGYNLARRLKASGAQLIVADINETVTRRAATELKAKVVSIEEIHAQEADIFAPCALGGAINADSIDDIQAYIVGGAANNQLKTPEMGAELQKRDILYCPDYVLNAGGIINVASEVSGTYDYDWVDGKLEGLRVTLKEVFDRSASSGRPTNEIADEMARERLKPS